MRKPDLVGKDRVPSNSSINKAKLRKGLWSPEEDEKLIKYMLTNGQGCWSDIARNAGLQRCGKSCRLRWINYLRPDLKRGAFSPQEEELIIHLHTILGNRYFFFSLFFSFIYNGQPNNVLYIYIYNILIMSTIPVAGAVSFCKYIKILLDRSIMHG
jgi:hypothetical protein